MEVKVIVTRSVWLWVLGILLLAVFVLALLIHIAALILEKKDQ